MTSNQNALMASHCCLLFVIYLMLFTARKANDILRDKLTDITSQYADAMDRLHTAECTHANQTDMLRVALDDLHTASATTFTLRKQAFLLIQLAQTY
jgi:hypothetical protein